ncbi:MAG: cation:proton antiporter [Candidatus Woesearchaeota archaeon]
MAVGIETVSLVTVIAILMFAIMFILKKFHQPHVISYILAGIILGPSVTNIVKDTDVLNAAGEIGLVLFMFFIGMEISIPQLMKGWKIAIIGTCLQIIASISAVFILGSLFAWPFERILLFGFIISISSTAVVLKLLKGWDELNTRVGRDVLSILIVQDIAIVIMLVIIGGMSSTSTGGFILPLLGGVLLVLLMTFVIRKGPLRLRFFAKFKGDHELEMVAALILAVGFAFVSGLFQLSTALGAFIAGVILSTTKETEWVHKHLYPLQVVFMAAFFLFIGIILDLSFILQNLFLVIGLVIAVLVVNTGINTLILRMLGRRWNNAAYGGVLLSQVGEFGFVLAIAGLHAGIITIFGYQLTIALIISSLLITPIYLLIMKKVLHPDSRRIHVPKQIF